MHAVEMKHQGAWLAERVGGWARVGGVAGTGFEAYARLLHPVPDPGDRLVASADHAWQTRRWAAVAAETGKRMHPLVQWGRLHHPQSPYLQGSSVGWLDPEVLAALIPMLENATSTHDDVIAGFWTGWGGERIISPASLELPGREYALLQTTLDELADPDWGTESDVGWLPSFRHPSVQLLWPADHRWIVASEVDWDSTIVAGARSLIDEILADPRFETFEVGVDDDLSWDGDTLN